MRGTMSVLVIALVGALTVACVPDPPVPEGPPSGGDTTAPTGSVVIDGGASATRAGGVVLTLQATDDVAVTEMRIADGVDPAAGVWESYAATKVWSLPVPDGPKTVSVQFRDAAGNVSSVASDDIRLDTAVPSTSIVIAAGGLGTAGRDVPLTVTADDPFGSGVSEMRLANGTDVGTAPWEPFAGAKAWTLAADDGVKTVSIQVRDRAGNESLVASDEIVLDQTGPAISSVTGDVSVEPSVATVVLSAAVMDGGVGVADVKVHTRGPADADFTETAMVPLAGDTYTAGLTVGSGFSYYVSASDQLGTGTTSPASAPSELFSVSPGEDTTGPTGSITINGDAPATNVSAVSLTLSATDNVGVTEMRVADGPDPSSAPWEPFAPSKPWTLPTGEGARVVSVEFRDAAGNTSIAATDSIVVDAGGPQIIDSTGDTTVFEGTDVVITASVTDSLTAVAGVSVFIGPPTGPFLPVAMSAVAGATWTATIPTPGQSLAYYVEATDAAGNVTRDPVGAPAVLHQVVFERVLVQLNPPPLDQTVETSMSAQVSFLFEGPSAPQQGVAPGTIDPEHIAVVRGRVLDREGSVIPNVRASVLGEPQFGWTYTRADGWFDIAVNGGRTLTIELSKDGWLDVQRSEELSWQQFSVLNDIVMVQPTATVSVVDPTTADPGTFQVAVGPTETDAAGPRQSVMLFPAGTTASATLPGGTTQALGPLSVRQTEFTVGESGLAAMPAVLPDSTAYTYAIEYSVDQAEALDASAVRFSEPVINYNDNFLNGPVGGSVPTAYYDEAAGSWIPEADAAVIGIVSETGGRADVDTDGDGVADGPATLALFGITDGERTTLADLYEPGRELWRNRFTHLTTYDKNFAVGIDCLDSEGNPSTQPRIDCGPPQDSGEEKGSDKNADEDTQCGSIIQCQSQTLGEQVPISGTGESLRYSSYDQPGQTEKSTIRFNYQPFTQSVSIVGSSIRVCTGGRCVGQTTIGGFGGFDYQFDGLDVYGRVLRGTQPTFVEICYDYPIQILTGRSNEVGLGGGGGAGGGGISVLGGSTWGGVSRTQNDVRMELLWPPGPRSRGTSQLCRSFTTSVTSAAPAIDTAGLGGWRLAGHHDFSPKSGEVSLGTGETIRRDELSAKQVINTSFGGGIKSISTASVGDPASSLSLGVVRDVEQDSKGNVYISSGTPTNRIYRFDKDGRFRWAYTANALYLAVDSKDRILYSNQLNNTGGRIWRIEPGANPDAPDDDVIELYAGTGAFPLRYSGDGGPAKAAGIGGARGIAVGPDDSTYIADGTCDCIRVVGPDGIIDTYAGGHGAGTSPGVRASSPDSKLSEPSDVAVDRTGALIVADGSRVTWIDPGAGRMSPIAGTADAGGANPADGATATSALLNPLRVSIDQDQVVHFTNERGGLVSMWRLEQGATGQFVLRRDHQEGAVASGDGGPFLASVVDGPGGVSYDSSGGMLVVDGGAARVRKVAPAAPFTDDAGNSLVPSPDASEVWVFDPAGKHLRTLDGLTGAVRRQFTYLDGRLSTFDDGDGNVTTIERNPAGVATAIIAPFGQRTTLDFDSVGMLASVTDPVGGSWRFLYREGGLMQRFTNPNGHATTKTYDSGGRLESETDGAGNTITLARAGLGRDVLRRRGTDITFTSAQGRATVYRTELMRNGDIVKSVVRPGGATDSTTTRRDGSIRQTAADGTFADIKRSPDPRWGQLAPYASQVKTTIPGVGVRTDDLALTVVNPNPRAPLGFTSLTSTARVNGTTTSTTAYTAATRLMTTTSSTSVVGRVTLDARGRAELIEPPSTSAVVTAPTRLTYDDRGRPTNVRVDAAPQDPVAESANDRVTTMSYGADGYLSSSTDPVGNVYSVISRDPLGRVVSSTINAQSLGSVAYDPIGNVTAITTPNGNTHQSTYDLLERPASYRSPAGKTWSYSYDRDDLLTGTANPDATSTAIARDSRGFAQYVTDPGFNGTLNYDTADRLSTATRDGVTTTNTWAGPLATQQQWTGAVAGTVGRSFDTRFRTTGVSVNGQSTPYAYDNDDRMTTAGTMAITYQVGTNRIDNTTAGVVTDTYTYDEFGDLATHSASAGSIPVFSQSYTRDKLGRITSMDDDGDATSYTYDARGRLQTATDSEGTRTYTYDANGNRLSRTDGTSAETGTYDQDDRTLTYDGASYTYTDTGELASISKDGQTDTYDYDHTGALKSATVDGTTVTYKTDPSGRRVARDEDGSRDRSWLYQDQLRPAAELSSTGSVRQRYAYAMGTTPSVVTESSRTLKVVTDHLGSPRAIVNTTTGEVVDTAKFDEYGRTIEPTSSGSMPNGFTGGISDRSTGLTRLGARDYGAQSGGWASRDGYIANVLEGGGFTYVDGDPVNRVDPTGFDKRRDLSGTGDGTLNSVLEVLGGKVYDTISGYAEVAVSYKLLRTVVFNRWINPYTTAGMLGKALRWYVTAEAYLAEMAWLGPAGVFAAITWIPSTAHASPCELRGPGACMQERPQERPCP